MFMTQPLPILYSFRRCPYAIRARMALLVSGTACHIREISLRSKPEEMITASPKATVPVLILPGGEVIDESIDIMRWALAHNDPENWLAGDDIALIAANDGPFKFHLDRYKYPHKYDCDPLPHRAASFAILSAYESRLTAHPNLCGDAPSLTDYAILPFVRQFAATDLEQPDDQDRERGKSLGMRDAKILKRRERADRRRDQVIGDEQKRADDRNHLGAMTDTRVNAAAIRVEPADDDVINPDERREDAHRRDQPKGGITADRKREADDIGLARAPVAIKNRGRARHIDIARSFNVGRYQKLRKKRSGLARRGRSCTLMTLTRLAVGLEPLNALDVAHIVRPDPSARARTKVGSPAGPALAAPLSRTKNCRNALIA